MPQEKKEKKGDVEKLSIILDNPFDPRLVRLLNNNDKSLESIRKRLAEKPTRTQTKPRKTRTKQDLEPRIIIHDQQEQQKPATYEKQPEAQPESQPEPQEEQEPTLDDLLTPDDLYEIEQEEILEEFIEVKPTTPEPKAEEIEPLEPPEQPEEPNLDTADEELPEWEPVPQPTQPPAPGKKETKFFQRLQPEPEPKNEQEPEPIPTWKPVEVEETAEPFPPQPSDEKETSTADSKQLQIEKRLQRLRQRQEKKEAKQQLKEAKRLEKQKAQEERKQQMQMMQAQTQETVSIPPPILEEEPTNVQPYRNAFQNIPSIDDTTADILFRNGYFSIDNLKEASIQELTAIKGINQQLAKQIKEEINKTTFEEPAKPEQKKPKRFTILQSPEKEKSEPDQQTPFPIPSTAEIEESTDESYEEQYLETPPVDTKHLRQEKRLQRLRERQEKKEAKRQLKEAKRLEKQKAQEERMQQLEMMQAQTQETMTIPPPKVDEEQPKTPSDQGVFDNIESIDTRTANLLIKHGYDSLESLQEATLDDITGIKGISKKRAVAIKEELEPISMPQPVRQPRKKQPPQPPKKLVETKEEFSEWETYNPEELSEIAEQQTGYMYGEYALYKKHLRLSNGEKTTIHFFSKEKPKQGEPTDIPTGYVVEVNSKTGLPYLKKKK